MQDFRRDDDAPAVGSACGSSSSGERPLRTGAARRTAPLSGAIPPPSTPGDTNRLHLRHRHVAGDCVLEAHSLDDADVAAGARAARTPEVRLQSPINDRDDGRSRRHPYPFRSYTDVGPREKWYALPFGGSRSVDNENPPHAPALEEVDLRMRLPHPGQYSHAYPQEQLHRRGQTHPPPHLYSFAQLEQEQDMRSPLSEKLERIGMSGSETDFLHLPSSASLRLAGDGGSSLDDSRSSSSSSMILDPPAPGGGVDHPSPHHPLGVEAERLLPPPAAAATVDGGGPAAAANGHLVVLGFDLSKYDQRTQFWVCAGGAFIFSLLYGYLQELISVTLCNRKLGLFLAASQFLGYTILSFFFRNLDKGRGGKGGGDQGGSPSKQQGSIKKHNLGSAAKSGSGSFSCAKEGSEDTIGGIKEGNVNGTGAHMSSYLTSRIRGKSRGGGNADRVLGTDTSLSDGSGGGSGGGSHIPREHYIGLSILRAIDLGMTNLAMQYVNYPAKTLMKSTRVVFTMMFGILITRKRYGPSDFAIVGLMVAGLGMFMHADAHTSAVFQPLGIVMLTVSLLCDGAISNMSEALMNQYDVGQDEFIYRLYSIALLFVCLAAAAKGDLRDGLDYLTRPGTLDEIERGLEPTWSVSSKIATLVLFSSTGFLGSSCSAAITKKFGALTMSITSTARKATTIFLSFALFPNKCTLEHAGGIVLFIGALVAKSFRASKRSGGHGHHHHKRHRHHHRHSKERTRAASPPVVELAPGCTLVTLRNTSSGRRKNLGDDAV